MLPQISPAFFATSATLDESSLCSAMIFARFSFSQMKYADRARFGLFGSTTFVALAFFSFFSITLATFGDLAGVAAFLADFGDFGEAFGDFTGVLDLTGDFFGVAIASSARSLWSLE